MILLYRSLALLFIWSIWGWFVRSNTHPHPRMVWKQSDLTISTLFLYICLIKATLILIYGPNESNSLKLYAHLHLNMFMHTHKLSIALKCLLAAFMWGESAGHSTGTLNDPRDVVICHPHRTFQLIPCWFLLLMFSFLAWNSVVKNISW